MKTLIFSLLAFLSLFITSSHAQTEFTCATIPPQGEQISATETHGIYLPAQGDLKILVVFARFKDDTTPHNEWPAGSDPPAYTTWIDPTMQTGSTNLENFTYYFKTMSMETFRVTGTAVSVETPQNKAYYFSLSNPRYEANKDILQNKVDPLVNFAQFDSWTFNSTYSHSNQPDGTVDMIVMIWRGFAFAGDWGGEASLGYGGSFTVENGTKTIKTSFFGGGGSGVTVHYSGTAYRKYNFHAAVHEIAHWLIGGVHPYAGEPRYAFWGMLNTSFVAGMCANTFERARLGWITPIAVSTSTSGSLPDFITTGTAYSFHPSAGGTNEWYYFENHQKLSIYDDATANPNDKGIWVIHQRDLYNSTDNIRIKPQDGFWNWDSVSHNSTCFPPNNITVFRKQSVNRNSTGYGIRQKLARPYGIEWPHAVIQNGSEICGGFFRGDYPFVGAFNPAVNNVFSRWSNPTANTWTDGATDFAMELTGQVGNTISTYFYVGNPLAAPPSKPQNLIFTNANQNNQWPNLIWTANIEPDLLGYDVWREYKQGGGYTETSKVGSLVTTTSFTDYGIKTSNTGSNTITYWVIAVDNTYKVSSPSEKVTSLSRFLPKHGDDDLPLPSGDDVPPPVMFALAQNFPNPFNPETRISFDLPEAADVSIAIMDLLGREVTTITATHYLPGSHSVKWAATDRNGNQLGSGIYFCRINVVTEGGSRFTKVMKMLLAK